MKKTKKHKKHIFDKHGENLDRALEQAASRPSLGFFEMIKHKIDILCLCKEREWQWT
jgi:hypothetical protein